MKYLKSCLVFIIGGFLLFGIQAQPTAQQVDPANNAGQQPPDVAADKEKPKYAPDRVIVKFKSDGPHAVNEDTEYILESKGKFKGAVSDKSDSLDNLTKKHNVKRAKSVFIDRYGLTTADAGKKQNDIERLSKAKHQSRSRRAPKDAVIPDLSNVYVLEVPPESDIEAIVQEFQTDPHVEYAQPDYIMELYMVPNDPYYSSNYLWGLPKIQMPQAWDITQGEGIVIAVVDTGLDYNHPDIAANVWTNPGEIPNNGLDDDGNGYVDDVRGWDFANGDNDPMDGHGHGTHVSGTIAAVGNNGMGIIGVAPKAKIMPVKGFSDNGYSSGLAKALVYAAQNGADVINNSWGCDSPCPSNPDLEDAVRTAYNSGKHPVIIFAAGNSTDDVSQYSPQNMTNPKPVVVSATAQADTPAFFTNVGALVDVSAPGVSIYSLKAASIDYVSFNGTSMAAPHVAGVAALILAYHPTFTNEEVRQILRVSADDVDSSGFDMKTGAGRLNAAKALTTIPPSLSAKITSPANGANYGPNQTIVITGTASGVDLKQYELFYYVVGVEPASWVALGPAVQSFVENAPLGILDIMDVPGSYLLLRLVATSTSGVQFDDVAGININDLRLRQIATRSSDQLYPVISSNKIIWQDYRNGMADIYLYDLITQTEKRITANPSGQRFPDIAGDKIVWVDDRNGNDDIYLYDLSTNIEKQITASSSSQTSPAISGDKIVWEDYRSGADIYLYDLATNTEKRITTDSFGFPSSKISPDISGDNIVWTDYRNGNADIYLYNLSTKTEKRITTDTSNQEYPAISGDNIVWTDYRNGNADIYLYNLSTKAGKWITTNSSDQWFPAISGNLIVWQDYRNGSADIYLYDLSTNKEKWVTTHPSDQRRPAIFDDKIVWQDFRNSNWDIYLQQLNRVPVLNPVGNRIVNEEDLLTFSVSALDPDSDSLTYTSNGLPIGATFSGQTFSWTPNFSQAGNYSVMFTVSDGTLFASETITIAVVDVPMPDLTASSLSTMTTVVTPGNSFILSDTAVNQGTAAAGSFTVVFSLSKDAVYGGTDDIAFSATRSVISLAAGANSSASTTLTVPTTTPLGNYYVCARADSGNTVTESDEANNGRCTTTTVQIALPDLVMTQISGPTSAATGASISFVNTVKNQGISYAGNFSVGFYLSTDAVITTTDTRIGTRIISSLSAGFSNSATTTVTVTTTLAAGTYYIGAIADYSNLRTETSETNNALTGNTIVMTPGVDLVMTAVSGPGSGVKGTSIGISNTVKNQGVGGVASFAIGLYLSPDSTITTSDLRIGTRSIGSLAAGATSSATTSVTIPATIASGTYYIGAVADYNKSRPESNETNNARAGNTIVVQ